MQIPYIKEKCVYLLRRKECVIYVGKSNVNVYARLGEHFRNKEFDSIELIQCQDEKELEKVESDQILKHRPEGNNRLKKNDKYLTKMDIKRLKKIDFRLVKKIVKEQNIEVIKVGRTIYYDSEIKKYL